MQKGKKSKTRARVLEAQVANMPRGDGFEVEPAYIVGDGEAIDPLARRNGEFLTVDIGTGKSNAKENTTRDLGLKKVSHFVPDELAPRIRT